MAITVTGTDPVNVLVGEDTTTDLTTNTTSDVSSVSYQHLFHADVTGQIDAGVSVTGRGLRLASTKASGAVSIVNNGNSTSSAGSDGVALIGSGGLVSYSGNGSASSTGSNWNAVYLQNSSAGDIDFGSLAAPVTGAIFSASGIALAFIGQAGTLDAFMSGGSATTTSTTGTGFYFQTTSGAQNLTLTNGVSIQNQSGAANNTGGIRSATQTGAINFDIDAQIGVTGSAFRFGVNASATGAAPVTVAQSGGLINFADGSGGAGKGIYAQSVGGAITITTAGSAQITGAGSNSVGVHADQQGATGAVSVTLAGRITGAYTGVYAATTNASNAEAVTVTVNDDGDNTLRIDNGVTAISASHAGTGSVSVNGSGDIRGSTTGIFARQTNNVSGTDANITIAGSGDVTATYGHVIDASITGANNAGDVIVTRSGAIRTDFFGVGIRVRTNGTGDLVVGVDEDGKRIGSITAGGGVAIDATSTAIGAGGVSVVTASGATIQTTDLYDAIQAVKSAAGAGAVSVKNGAAIQHFFGGIGGSAVYAANAGDGGVTVTNTGVISGDFEYGVFAQSTGASGGDVTVVSSGAIGSSLDRVDQQGLHAEIFNSLASGAVSVTADAYTGGDSHGVSASNTGAGAVTVGGAGEIAGGTSAGVYARQTNNAAGTDANVTVSGAGATTSVSSIGIDAQITGANNTGDVIVTRTGASTAGTTGIYIRTAGVGDLAAGVDADGQRIGSITSGGIAIDATSTVCGAGGVSVVTASGATIQTASLNNAIQAVKSGTGAGAVSVTNNAALQHSSGTGGIAINATNAGTGGVTVTNTGAISGVFDRGVVATTSAASGGVSVTNSGQIGTAGAYANQYGVYAEILDGGNAQTLSVVADGFTAGFINGVYAEHRGTGAISISGSGEIASTSSAAIYARQTGTGEIAVSGSGATTSANGRGIDAQITNAASSGDVTVTRTGAINSATQGIFLRTAGSGDLVAGVDEDGKRIGSITSGGNAINAVLTGGAGGISIVTDADATITVGDNINAIIVGKSGALVAALSVRNNADIVHSAGGSGGFAIQAYFLGNSASTVSVTNTGAISGSFDTGIYATTGGTGSVTATSSGAIGSALDHANAYGIIAEILNGVSAAAVSVTANAFTGGAINGVSANHTAAGAVMVDGSGEIASTTEAAIYAQQNGNVAGADANVTVSGSGATTSANGVGIDAAITGENNTGDVIVTRSGAITAATTGILLRTAGTGDLVAGVDAAGQRIGSITSGGIAIDATSTANGAGGVSVVTASGATIQTAGSNINAIVAVKGGTGAGAVSVANNATIQHSGGGGGNGILATNAGSGGVTIANAGAISGDFSFGIQATTAGAGGVSVTTSGAIGAAGDYADSKGVAAEISSAANSQALTVTANAFTAGATIGVLATHTGTGAIAVGGSGEIASTSAAAIHARQTHVGAADADITVSGSGATTSAFDIGVDAAITNAGNSGDVIVTRSGAITAATTGILLRTAGTGDLVAGVDAAGQRIGSITSGGIAIDATSTANGAGGVSVVTASGATIQTAGTNTAINAAKSGTGAGAVSVINNATLQHSGGGSGGTAINATNAGDGGVTVTSTGVISGPVGLRFDYAFNAEITNAANAQSISVTANAAVAGNVVGVLATHYGDGAIAIAGSGDISSMNGTTILARQYSSAASVEAGVTISGTGATTGVYGTAIEAVITNNANSGDISITRSGAISGDNGVSASTAGAGDVTITTTGLVTADNSLSGNPFSGHGVVVNATTGAVDIDINGGLSATADGVFVTTSATVSVDIASAITASGVGVRLDGGTTRTVTIAAAGSIDSDGTGVSSTGGSTTVSVAGSIANGAGTAISFDTTSSNNIVDLTTSGSIAGLIDGGSISDTFRLSGVSGSATFDMSQLQNFEAMEKTGASVWTLTGVAIHSGGVALKGGTLILDTEDVVGAGAVAFNTGAQILRLNAAETNDGEFANTIDAFGAGDRIELSAFSYSGGVTGTFASGVLTVNAGASSIALTITNAGFTSFRFIDNGNDAVAIVGNVAATTTGDLAITVAEGGTVAVATTDLSASDTDQTDAELIYTVTATTYGSVLLNGSALSIGQTFTQADLAANLISFAHDGSENDGSFTTSLSDVSTTAPSVRTVTATVNPHVNDIPTFGGDATGYVMEDDAATLTTGGTLTIDDPDPGEAFFQPEILSGLYGSFSIDGNGVWSYAAQNDQTVVQALGQGVVLYDSFTVSSFDGTATTTIDVLIQGINDAPTFAVPDGVVKTHIGSSSSGRSVALQSDGRILFAGSSHSGASNDFALARYNADGSLDTSFGGGDGIVTTAISTGEDFAQSVLEQPDGAIIVAGYGAVNATDALIVVRYTATGDLDTNFGNGGIVTALFGSNSEGYSVALQSDGGILVAGTANFGSGRLFAVARYTATGDLDTSFGGGDGVATIDLGHLGVARSVVVQPDGNILLAGYREFGPGVDFALVRLTPNGDLDPSFDGDGIRLDDFTAGDRILDAALMSDGRIMVIGDIYNGGVVQMAVARYNADGTLDFDFNGGLATVGIGGFARGHSVAVHPNGAVYAAGYGEVNGATEIVLARFNGITGAVESVVTTAVDLSAGGFDLVIQPDGRILVVGERSNSSGGSLVMVRYNADGTLDRTFGPEESTLDATPTFVEGGAAVVLDPDAAVGDVEYDAVGSYAGATLTLARSGGANADDVFGGSGALSLSSGNVDINGETVGAFTQSGGVLTITFGGLNATGDRVNAVLRQLTYSNASEAPPASAQINWTFSDDGPNALAASGSTTVAITAVNDAPTDITGVLSVNEYAANGTSVGTVAAVDADDLAFTYSLIDNAGGRFTINATTGQIRVADGLLLDREQAASHMIKVKATDAGGLFVEKILTVSVGDVDPENVVGDSRANVLYGGPGADRIDGRGGADFMHGLGGSDLYFVDNVNDKVFEAVGGGDLDMVATSVDYTLTAGQEIEILTPVSLASTNAINLTGNEFANRIGGNEGVNRIDGGAGADNMFGYGGNDFYTVDNAGDRVNEAVGGGAADMVVTKIDYQLTAGQEIEILTPAELTSTNAINLTGNEFANRIGGNAGVNRIDGGGGADNMFGYDGNDFYTVDNAGDRVNEAVGGGALDMVVTTVNYTLTAGQEIEILTPVDLASTNAINLTGNEFANRIGGNEGVNRIDGGGGADNMFGYGGNDFYTVDNASDRVNETVGGGALDMVVTKIDYTLTAGQEIEILTPVELTSTNAINLTGNEFANRIGGNEGVNRIDGGAGADNMFGYGGNDFYTVDNAGDRVNEAVGGGAADMVVAKVNYTLTAGQEIEILTPVDLASSNAINLTGNEFANRIGGNEGVNHIDGGAGADVLFGYGGNDVFVFRKGQAHGDTIYDFVGNGVAAGDSFEFIGYGSGATFTIIDATHWQINYNGGASHEVIAIANGASIHGSDYLFS